MAAERFNVVRLPFVVAGVFVAAMLAAPAHATSPYVKDVCASGCTYSTVQSAVDSITDSAADKVYTILLDAGVLNSNTSTYFGGKSYINLVGRGMGTSILRATGTWFTNVNSGTETHPNFVDLAGSTNIKIANLSVDARTNSPGGVANNPSGVAVDNADRITIDGCQIEGDVHAVSEFANTSDHLIEILGSNIRAIESGVRTASAVWHIFSTEIEAINNGEGSGTQSAIGLQMYGGTGASTVVWGSHIHGESNWSQSNDVEGVYLQLTGGAEFVAIGSTLHAKLLNAASPNTRYVAALQLATGSTTNGRVDVIGSQLIYQTPTGMTQGDITGILFGRTTTTTEINLVGGSIADIGGDGGAYRADIERNGGGGPGCSIPANCMPNFRAAGTRTKDVLAIGANPIASTAKGFDTVNKRRGSATFPGTPGVSSLSVSLSPPMPDADYRIGLSVNANETIWVTGKSTSGFTLNTTTSGSSATVEWILSR